MSCVAAYGSMIPGTSHRSIQFSGSISASIRLRAPALSPAWLSTARSKSNASPISLRPHSNSTPSISRKTATMVDPHSIFLLSAALIAVVCLILLVAVFKLNPFITLFVVSLGLAIAVGMPLSTVMRSFETGMGATLGHIAIVVALGTMLGKMMAESGGADRIAHTLIGLFGEKRIHWAMMVIGLIVGLPAFFEVGFVLLIPIAFTVARRTKTSLILVGIPMVAGLSVVHGLVPPHPAAMLAVTAYGANVGHTIFYALIIGVPTAIIAGPLYAKLISPHIKLPAENPIAAQFVDHAKERSLPSFWLTLFTILFPVVLMLVGSWADAVSTPGGAVNQCLHLVGNDDMALLIGV